MIRILALGAAALTLGGSAVSAQSLDTITVEVTPTTSSVDLGETLDLTVAVTNLSTVGRDDLTTHIDITSLDEDGSVDPEDWTATLSKDVGPLAAGASAELGWSIQPISPGNFTVYAVVLAPDAPHVVASNVLTVRVADRRSLNPQGVLPVALAVPAGIGLLLSHRWRRSRR